MALTRAGSWHWDSIDEQAEREGNAIRRLGRPILLHQCNPRFSEDVREIQARENAVRALEDKDNER